MGHQWLFRFVPMHLFLPRPSPTKASITLAREWAIVHSHYALSPPPHALSDALGKLCRRRCSTRAMGQPDRIHARGAGGEGSGADVLGTYFTFETTSAFCSRHVAPARRQHSLGCFAPVVRGVFDQARRSALFGTPGGGLPRNIRSRGFRNAFGTSYRESSRTSPDTRAPGPMLPITSWSCGITRRAPPDPTKSAAILRQEIRRCRMANTISPRTSTVCRLIYTTSVRNEKGNIVSDKHIDSHDYPRRRPLPVREVVAAGARCESVVRRGRARQGRTRPQIYCFGCFWFSFFLFFLLLT